MLPPDGLPPQADSKVTPQRAMTPVQRRHGAELCASGLEAIEKRMLESTIGHGPGAWLPLAQAIDKDHEPKWDPARIDDVTADPVAAFFGCPGWRTRTRWADTRRPSDIPPAIATRRPP